EQHGNRALSAAQRVGFAGRGGGGLRFDDADRYGVRRFVGLGVIESIGGDRRTGAAIRAAAAFPRCIAGAVAGAIAAGTAAGFAARLTARFARGASLAGRLARRTASGGKTVGGSGIAGRNRPPATLAAGAGFVEVGIGVEAGHDLLRDLELDQLLDLGQPVLFFRADQRDRVALVAGAAGAADAVHVVF